MNDPNQGNNDWSSPNLPATTSPGAQAPPGKRNQALGDGIGSVEDSTSLFGEAQNNAKRFYETIKGPTLKTLLAIYGANIALVLVSLLFQIPFFLLEIPAVASIFGGLFGILSAILSVFASVYTVASFRQVSDRMRGVPVSAPTSLKEALSLAKPYLVPALLTSLVVGFAVGLGSFCCVIPGVIAFIALTPARYLSVTREPDIGSALSASVDIGKRYWLLVLMFGFVGLLVGGVIGGISAGISMGVTFGSAAIASSLSSQAAATAVIAVFTSFGSMIAIALSVITVVILWVVEGGVMFTLESKEYGPDQDVFG